MTLTDRNKLMELISSIESVQALMQDAFSYLFDKMDENFISHAGILTEHLGSASAHPAESISYAGGIVGTNVHQALERLKSQIDQLNVISAGEDSFIYAENFPRIALERDDTGRLQRAFASAISSQKPLILEAITYDTSDTIFNAVSVKNITVIGKGLNITKFNFTPEDSVKPLIQLVDCRFPVFNDFTITGTDKKGIGMKFGSYNTAAEGNERWNPVAYGTFSRVRAYGLNIGIDHDSGWINDFYSCSVHSCATGIRIHGNALNFYSFVSENNDIGVDITRGEMNSTISFFGGCVETNQIGFKIRFAHDINLFGMYLENQPGGHILAGTDDGDSIEIINIIGGSWHFAHPVIFDRVNTLNLEGAAEYKTASPLTITERVKQIKLPALQTNFEATDTIEAVEIRGTNRQTSVPWYVNDFSTITIPPNTASTLILDSNNQITLVPHSTCLLNEYTTDFLTGNKAIKCSLPAGKTFGGMTFIIKPTYIQSDSMCVKLPVYSADTMSVFRILVTVRYKLQDGSIVSLDTFDFIPPTTGDYALSNFLNKWMSFIVPINIKKAKALPNYAGLVDVRVGVYGSLRTIPATGGEWFAVDSLEVYQTKYITNPYNDSRTIVHQPLEINPTTINSESILSKKFKLTQQLATANAVNGTLFEDVDGKLKYKNLAGVVTDLTL